MKQAKPMNALRKLLVAAGWLAAFAVLAGIVFWARPIECFDAFTRARFALTGGQSRSVTINGHRVHYNAQGPAQGPPVVLVHGLGGSAEDWRYLSPYLARAGYRVYMPDLPGYGRSERPADFSYSMPDEADAVVGFLDALGLRQVDLGGWSMGGWIVQLVASRHPERVSKLMLFGSAGISVKPDWDTRLFTPANAEELDQLDALLMPNPSRIPVFVADDLLRLSHEHAWVIQRALASMLQGRDATDGLLPQLKMPVLLVWGGEDRIMPVGQGQTMHRLIPQSQLDIVSGCGHLAPEQCTDRIGPRVVEFVGR